MTSKKKPVKNDGALVPYQVAQDSKGHEGFLLRRRGESWETIAEQVGYANAVTAMVEVGRYTSSLAVMRSDAQRADDLEQELDRLNTLQSRIWDAALTGDLQAVDRILKIISLRAKLLGIDVQQDRTTTNNTIVVTGDSTQFVERLKEIAGEVNG